MAPTLLQFGPITTMNIFLAFYQTYHSLDDIPNLTIRTMEVVYSIFYQSPPPPPMGFYFSVCPLTKPPQNLKNFNSPTDLEMQTAIASKDKGNFFDKAFTLSKPTKLVKSPPACDGVCLVCVNPTTGTLMRPTRTVQALNGYIHKNQMKTIKYPRFLQALHQGCQQKPQKMLLNWQLHCSL